MKITILSLFPEFFRGPFSESMMKRAQERGLLSIEQVNIRDFALDKHKVVDDKPYGGGSGMLLKPEPLIAALRHVTTDKSYVVYMTPRGKPFTTKKAQELAQKKELILISGHYEGIDERVLGEVDEEISIGDYVLTNGCVASIVVVDALVRFVPGVLGDSDSAVYDSFSDGLLEHGHFTRPADFEGRMVPEELLSGDHMRIARWRKQDALQKTYAQREDLYVRYLGQESKGKGAACILEVTDLAASVRFYRKVCGFKIESLGKDRALFVLEEGRRLLLVEGCKRGETASMQQLVLHGEKEFERIRNRLAKAAPFFDAADEKTTYFRDLDGHLWMLYINIEEKIENG